MVPIPRRALLTALFLLAAVPAGAQPGPAVSDGKAVDAWVLARVKAAKQGARELVRVPLVRRTAGWGCPCPWYFVGDNVGSYDGKSWLSIKAGPQVKLAEKREGWVQLAEGFFTGRSTREDNSKQCGGCKDYVYTLYELQVDRVRPAPKSTESPRVHLLLGGQDAAEKVAPLADGKPWLVMVASVARGDQRAAAQAAAQRDKLVKAGFADAAVLDSRSAPLLACCYHVVVAGRRATQAEANALAQELKKKKLPASVKKGF